MGLTLGVLHEALADYHKKSSDESSRRQVAYCERGPLVYFDIGTKQGIPSGRVIVELQRKDQPELVDHFLHLCIGISRGPKAKSLSYRNARISAIDSRNKTLLIGSVDNGRATFVPSSLGGIEVMADPQKSPLPPFPCGSLVMLPFSFDSSRFSSLFYFYLGHQGHIHDGLVIGKIIQGQSMLLNLISNFSTPFSVVGDLPKRELRIVDCGRL